MDKHEDMHESEEDGTRGRNVIKTNEISIYRVRGKNIGKWTETKKHEEKVKKSGGSEDMYISSACFLSQNVRMYSLSINI